MSKVEELQQRIKNAMAATSNDGHGLPEGWTESRPGGMATNRDPLKGGIIDCTFVTQEWFIVFERDCFGVVEGLPSRAAAFEMLAEVIHAHEAALSVREPSCLDINGRRFAPAEQSASREGKPEVDGYFEREPNGIRLLDRELKPFIFAVAHQSQGYFFVSCSRHGEQIRYMHRTSSLEERALGLDGMSESDQRGLARSLFEQLDQELPRASSIMRPRG